MTDLLKIAEPKWDEACRRSIVLRPLAERSYCPRHQAHEAAATLGLSVRQVYRLIRQLREAQGELTALLSQGSDGGRGKKRLAASRENLLHRLIDDLFVTRQKISAADLVREVRNQSLKAALKPPSDSTIRRRLKALSLIEHRRRGELHPETKPIYGVTPLADGPFDWLQIDHTPVDLIIVDPIDRSPIGRPWITVAVDVFSRCIAGFHLSLEAPSATSVGLCMASVVSDKVEWLHQRGVEADWPVVGKPRRVGVDNASEFHSAAFERGCAQHDIKIEWRPPGRPHFGGIIERLIGTLMKLVHMLPGTTFSNITERGKYDSDQMASLTLEELERWLTVAVTKYYHLRPHEGIDNETPLHRYTEGLKRLSADGKTIPMPRDPRGFLIDFLPVVYRKLQRDGITLDHITYYSNALRPWIQLRTQPNPLLIRRDPRDLSRIFVLDPESHVYLEVPYRMLSRPAITLWEHRLARKRLRDQQHAAINEESLFTAIDEMRKIEHHAENLTRTARRNRTRRAVNVLPTLSSPTIEDKQEQSNTTFNLGEIRPFDDIESW